MRFFSFIIVISRRDNIDIITSTTTTFAARLVHGAVPSFCFRRTKRSARILFFFHRQAQQWPTTTPKRKNRFRFFHPSSIGCNSIDNYKWCTECDWITVKWAKAKSRRLQFVMLSAAIASVAAFFRFIISALRNERCDSLLVSGRLDARAEEKRTTNKAPSEMGGKSVSSNYMQMEL